MIAVRDSRTHHILGLFWSDLQKVRSLMGERDCEYARVECDADIQFIEMFRVDNLPPYVRVELSDDLLAVDFRAGAWLPLQHADLECAA